MTKVIFEANNSAYVDMFEEESEKFQDFSDNQLFLYAGHPSILIKATLTARLTAFSLSLSRERERSGRKKEKQIDISHITRDFPIAAGVGEQSDPETTAPKVDSKISVDTPLTEYGRDRIERRRGQIYIYKSGGMREGGRGGASVHLVCIPVCAMSVSNTVSHR